MEELLYNGEKVFKSTYNSIDDDMQCSYSISDTGVIHCEINNLFFNSRLIGTISVILAVDSAIHEIIYADLSYRSTTEAQVMPYLIKQTHRQIREASADVAYDTRYWHGALLSKKIKLLIPPRSGSQYWPDR